MESPFKYIIVDDEYPAHDVIKALLLPYPQFELADSYYNGEDAIAAINSNENIALVFLDVNMPQIDGMTVLSKLENKPSVIITTAHTQFAFEAYEKDAIDYLQKPISAQRFDKAMQKAIAASEKKKAEQKKIIIIKSKGLHLKIDEASIMYIRSMGNFSKFYIKSKPSPLILNEALSKQILKLNRALFIQIHRTCIINTSYITGRKDNTIVLNKTISLPIGRKYLPIINGLMLDKS
jgi:two-component system, LytTR family, response regulator